MTGDEERLINAHAMADILGVSVETIWRYTREGKIPHVEVGNRQYRYCKDDVLDAMRASRVREEKESYEAERDKTYTYEDYLELPDEPGYSWEVLDGTLVKEPSPNVMHQRVSRRLQRLLEDYFGQADPRGEVFDAPLDVTMGEKNVVQPDLFYVSGKQCQIVKEKRIDGSPELVIEMISPFSQRKDRLEKLEIYQTNGVQHYWLVHPE
ncbi:MAG: Uma2 family endonuclease, partial [Bacillota bacterium]